MPENEDDAAALKRSPEGEKVQPSRRSVLKGLTLAAGGGMASSLMAPRLYAATSAEYPKLASVVGDSIVASDSKPIVETDCGKVRGYIKDGMFTFKGIPYGADTAGANRFMPPRKPAPWAGVRSSMQYGYVSPHPPRIGWMIDEVAWLFSWNDGVAKEDCLRVNVWSPGINDGKKRPVMVWLHGGGYTEGSGNELLSYDGERLARRGDVVVVSLNHRLNVFGFLNLASFGEKYAESANVGMLDIVAALNWVQANIANFGGDPGKVTIFGQSGGGGKVTTLMAMPSAKGLFHHAIVQSGSILQAGTKESSARLAQSLLDRLNLTASSVDRLQQIPMDQLEQAGVAVTPMNMPASGVIDFRHAASMLGWGPSVDGSVLPAQPFDPQAPAISATVPLLVGNTLNEFATGMGNPAALQMTETEMTTRVQGIWKEKGVSLIDAARAAYPGATPFEVWSVIATSPVRASTLTQARRKAMQQSAPAYCYSFNWQTPVLDGRPMAFHCSEISFVFDNTDRCENMTGGGPGARDLAGRISDAWIQFARSGNPNHPGLPHWSPITPNGSATMVFEQKCEFRTDLDDALQKLMAED